MSLKGRVATVVAGFVGVLSPASARADDACTSHVSFVRLGTPDHDATIALALLPHLRAELNARDIGVCLAGADPPTTGAREPIAEIVIHDDGKTLTLTIRDWVTNKRVERELNLASLPPDTVLLAIATSIDELLRASWLETLLASPRAAAPAPVTRAVLAIVAEPEPAPAPPPLRPRRVRVELGAGAILSVLPGLRAGVGLDVTGALWLAPRLGAYARAGFSRGAHEESVNGAIASDVFRGGVGVLAAIVPSGERVGVRAEAGFDAMRVGFRADALERATVIAAPALVALTAALGLRSWVDLGPVRALVGVSGQYALAPAVGTDQTLQGAKIEVTGVKGLGFEASAGVAWAF